MNNDYPIIQATAVMAEAVVLPPASGKTTAPRPGLKTNGRSSRVMLPKQRSYAIQNAEIERLQEQGFTKGLAETLTKNNAMFPLRIWVVDNSGSMNRQDGHRIIETFRKDNVKLVDCTRWAEIQQTVEYHAQMSALVKAPTVFRLLNDPGRINGPQQFSIAEHHSNSIDHDLSVALQTMKNSSPGGATPLTEHIQEIRANLVEMEPTLRRDGSRVAIILATDGLPSSIYGVSDNMAKQEFVRSLRSLEGLPVWVVVRLCTDDEEVVQFYNDLDSQLELSLEVLDDFVGEAEEVYEHNKWLNYALPLHRLREMGYHNRLFDLLDERQLTPDELKEFMRILFGKDAFDGVPDPQADWVSFRKSVEVMLRSEKNQWNPIRKKVMPWIDIKKLEKSYKTKGCSIM
eukprot:CAMPEP_0202445096 /NCGR_PEP_ID=MMETSP1360-20130828/3979_1 /ASSEMBLY_ACC=CAM_ASM_000848 /TAXON_ID=515479 /ORGANISM="Licmophora paradoxa, Strain CCMP2313" /LENGTH=400 /DNA_ID=CAMNT_0049061249 /DNA_START=81 /DNA_END=1283 /DNA_ORIENTATION=+